MMHSNDFTFTQSQLRNKATTITNRETNMRIEIQHCMFYFMFTYIRVYYVKNCINARHIITTSITFTKMLTK